MKKIINDEPIALKEGVLHHDKGIYVGDGKVIEASSSKGRVVIRDL